jgi:hypothetical protein
VTERPAPGKAWDGIPRRLLRIITLLALAPYGYALLLVLLHLVSAPAVAAWVRPSLPWIEAALPVAATIQAGHRAAGHPVYGMVNAHLLAVGHISGLALCVIMVGRLNTAALLRNMLEARRRPGGNWLERRSWWFQAICFLGFGLLGLWLLALDSVALRPDGRFSSGQRILRHPGLVLILFVQFGWLLVGYAVVLLRMRIIHGRDAMSGTQAGPPSGA